jgi:hypothetical protein
MDLLPVALIGFTVSHLDSRLRGRAPLDFEFER